MDEDNEKIIEKIVTIGIRIGTIATIKRFGLASEIVTLQEAYNMYTRYVVESWRKKRWVNFYSTGGKKNSKTYCKRSELEIASALMEFGNIIPTNKIFKAIQE